jgi:hypothetical protein
VWNEHFDIQVKDVQTTIFFNVLDDDLVGYDMHGYGKLNISENATFVNQRDEKEIPIDIYIAKSTKLRGRVYFKLEWLADPTCPASELQGNKCNGHHWDA